MIKNKYYKIGKLKKRICLLADIHYSENYDLSLFTKIIVNIQQNKPDYICIPGDIVDESSILLTDKKNHLTKFIKDLSKICPVILAKGNHDETKFLKRGYTYLSVETYFKSLNRLENVYYLDNKTLVRGDITFTGLSLSYDYYYDKHHEQNTKFINEIKQLKKINKAKYNILLVHSPVNTLTDLTLKEAKEIKMFDLILSGHMHNGLVFNFLDKNRTRGWVGPFKDFFPKYAKGKLVKQSDNKQITLIVTGGIIKFSEHAPKLFYHLNGIYPNSIDYIDI